MFYIKENREEEADRAHQQIDVINTLAILFIEITNLSKFRAIKYLGHLHIVSMLLISVRKI